MFCVGNMKGWAGERRRFERACERRICQQTFVDTHSKMAFARLHDRRTGRTVTGEVQLDPAQAEARRSGNMATEESIANLREQLGLNDSPWEQFIGYPGGVLQDDPGVSLFTSDPMAGDLMERAPATLEPIFYALLLTVIIGAAIAVPAVVRPGGIADCFSRFHGMAAGATAAIGPRAPCTRDPDRSGRRPGGRAPDPRGQGTCFLDSRGGMRGSRLTGILPLNRSLLCH